MTDDDWENGYAQAIGVFVNGESIHATDPFGGRITDETFLLLFNASDLDLEWTLPGPPFAGRWAVEFDTVDPAAGTPGAPTTVHAAGTVLPIHSRSITVLRRLDPLHHDDHPTRRTVTT
jgi:glycogen operon protein